MTKPENDENKKITIEVTQPGAWGAVKDGISRLITGLTGGNIPSRLVNTVIVMAIGFLGLAFAALWVFREPIGATIGRLDKHASIVSRMEVALHAYLSRADTGVKADRLVFVHGVVIQNVPECRSWSEPALPEIFQNRGIGTLVMCRVDHNSFVMAEYRDVLPEVRVRASLYELAEVATVVKAILAIPPKGIALPESPAPSPNVNRGRS